MSDPKSTLVALQGNVCLSGGAPGSDCQWGMLAGRASHSVIHWSFEKHKFHAPEAEIVVLSQDYLDVANDYVARANKTLKRRWPPGNPYTGNLLRRNFYQVTWADSIYAIGTMKKNNAVDGGTAWATQMYMDRFLIDGEDLSGAAIYFFDQTTNQWWFWNGSWTLFEGIPPVPTGVWAGIGTREMSDEGKWAARNIFGWFKDETSDID